MTRRIPTEEDAGAQAQNDVENESSSFDALAFAEQLYSTIDSIRSHISAQYDQLAVTAPTSSGGIGETKLNAFFRMIGLPAAASPSFIKQFENDQEFKDIISQDGTLNYFHTITNNEQKDGEIFTKLQKRNEKLTTKPDPERFAQFMFDPIAVSEGVVDGSTKRTSLFPLIVDAAVPVYPLSRRLAPSFRHTINGEDYIPFGNTARLSRPLIDNIIYMRIKTVNNDAGKEALSAQLKALLSSANQANSQITTDIGAQFTFIDVAIKTKLLQILKSLATQFEVARKEVQTLSTQISFVFSPVSNAASRSAQSTDIKPEAKVYALDDEINQLKAEIATQNAIAFMLPTEQVKRREELRRIEHGVSTSNITSDVLISQLNGLITYEAEELNRKLQEKQHERDEKLSQAERLKQQLLYYTGEFSGLSIFDVICVIYGLFAVETKYLLGLLNQDARKRLMEDEFFRPPDASVEEVFNAAPQSVEASLDALQSKIREAFSIAEAFASRQAQTQ